MKFFRIRLVQLALLFPLVSTIGAANPAVVEMISSGRVNDAIQTLSTRDDPESFNLLSRVYYASERWDEAVKWGERAVSGEPGNAAYHLWLAREYGQKAATANPLAAAGIARKAKNEFERAVQLDPANVPARVDLAQYYTDAPAIMGGGLDKAREQAAQMANYDVSKSHLILARVAVKQKQDAAAEQQFRQAIAGAAEPADSWIDLAGFYRLQGRASEMQNAVQSAVTTPRRPASVFFDAADELYRGGRDLPGAAQYVEKYLASGALVESAPAFRAHYLLGQIYEKMGQAPAAVSQYQASLALAPVFEPAKKALRHLQ